MKRYMYMCIYMFLVHICTCACNCDYDCFIPYFPTLSPEITRILNNISIHVYTCTFTCYNVLVHVPVNALPTSCFVRRS